MNEPNPFDPKKGQATAEMINAFLRWKLPESVASDTCVTRPDKGRTGTNLLTVVEAMQMIQEVVCPIIAKHLAPLDDSKDSEIARLKEVARLQYWAMREGDNIVRHIRTTLFPGWTNLSDIDVNGCLRAYEKEHGIAPNYALPTQSDKGK